MSRDVICFLLGMSVSTGILVFTGLVMRIQDALTDRKQSKQIKLR